jgi:hypothetical protein
MEGPERVRQLLLSDTFAQVPFDKTESGELSLCLGTFFLKEIVSGVVFS